MYQVRHSGKNSMHIISHANQMFAHIHRNAIVRINLQFLFWLRNLCNLEIDLKCKTLLIEQWASTWITCIMQIVVWHQMFNIASHWNQFNGEGPNSHGVHMTSFTWFDTNKNEGGKWIKCLETTSLFILNHKNWDNCKSHKNDAKNIWKIWSPNWCQLIRVSFMN